MERIKRLAAHPDIISGLEFIRQDREFILEKQIELVQIPAPSNHEKEKALRFAHLLQEVELGEVVVDDIFNVYVIVKGEGGGPRIAISAHSDTVFPKETNLTVTQDADGTLHAPGIADDTRGMVEILSIARAVKAAKLKPVGDIILCCNVGEESLGDLKGVRKLCGTFPDLDAFITVDTANAGTVIYNGTGGNLYRVFFTGKGGHSFVNYGMPNPANAAARAVARFAELRLPEKPKTTINVGLLRGGTAPNAIPSEVMITVDARSNGQIELNDLDEKMRSIIAAAVDEENSRWGSDEKVSFRLEPVTLRPAATQPFEAPIVQTALECLKALNIPYLPRKDGASCTDANWAMHLGIPALALGRGGQAGNGHSVNEWFRPTEEYLGPQKDLLILFALAGLDGVSQPILIKRTDQLQDKE